MRSSTHYFWVLLAAEISLMASAAFAQTSTEANQNQAQRGEYLARVGDCSSCHTQVGGAPFSGGASIQSPLGAIYAPNITPDRETGIGNWSDEDFYRALHDGIGKGDRRLYPAMPYQWYTKVTRDDVLAIKAYLFSLPPVHKQSQKTVLPFPFDIRAGLAVWNDAFFKPGEFKSDLSKSAEYNRGAYLVEGLAHCGDCHTPRGYMLEPLSARAYSGGVIENWYASNITSDKERGIGRWSRDELFQYLKTGLYKNQGPIVGLMGQVVHESLSRLTDADLHAMVAYVRDIAPVVDYQATAGPALTEPHSAGATTYLTYCAFCHGRDGEGRPGSIPALTGNSIVLAKGPETVIRAVLGGLIARGNFASMPAIGQEMTNAQITNAVNYARNAWGNEAPANANDGLVEAIRNETYGVLVMRPSPNDQGDPCRSGDDAAPLTPINDTTGKIRAILEEPGAAESLRSVRAAIARVRQIAPNASQAEILNGLTQDYCKIKTASGPPTAEARRLINRFAQIAYAQLVSPVRTQKSDTERVEAAPQEVTPQQPNAKSSGAQARQPESAAPSSRRRQRHERRSHDSHHHLHKH